MDELYVHVHDRTIADSARPLPFTLRAVKPLGGEAQMRPDFTRWPLLERYLRCELGAVHGDSLALAVYSEPSKLAMVVRNEDDLKYLAAQLNQLSPAALQRLNPMQVHASFERPRDRNVPEDLVLGFHQLHLTRTEMTEQLRAALYGLQASEQGRGAKGARLSERGVVGEREGRGRWGRVPQRGKRW